MEHKFSSQLIAPGEVLKGEESWEKGKYLIPFICKRPLLLGKSKATHIIREKIQKDLEGIELTVISTLLDYGCCEEDLEKIQSIGINQRCDAVIAAGGGKVLDAGKLIANRLGISCITIPLSAATCAGWTALSNIYSPKGAFIKDVSLKNCPNLLIFDHAFIKSAPTKTLASGIADALAKWYESSISSSSSNDGMVQQAVQLARILRDQLLLDGYKSFLDKNTDEWIRTVEGCALSAGLIGGIGGAKCRAAAAHALHNGLTQLHSEKEPMHGEIVGFGILVQLKLEEMILNNQLAKQARIQIKELLRKLKLPLSLKDLGLSNSSNEELLIACSFACKKGLGIENLPFNVSSESLLKAVIQASKDEEILRSKIMEKTKA